MSCHPKGFFFRIGQKKNEKKAKERKKPVQRKPHLQQEGHSSISAPYAFVHISHVDQELNWSGDPESSFELLEKLGEGYIHATKKKQIEILLY